MYEEYSEEARAWCVAGDEIHYSCAETKHGETGLPRQRMLRCFDKCEQTDDMKLAPSNADAFGCPSLGRGIIEWLPRQASPRLPTYSYEPMSVCPWQLNSFVKPAFNVCPTKESALYQDIIFSISLLVTCVSGALHAGVATDGASGIMKTMVMSLRISFDPSNAMRVPRKRSKSWALPTTCWPFPFASPRRSNR